MIKTYDIVLTRELHIIRAHQLHYSSLIEDLRKTVEFVRDTKNPAMDSFSDAIRKQSEKLMQRECKNLINEIQRLDKGRAMQDERLKNVTHLVGRFMCCREVVVGLRFVFEQVFSSVNIDDSKRMQRMTEAAVKDSAGMVPPSLLLVLDLKLSCSSCDYWLSPLWDGFANFFDR